MSHITLRKGRGADNHVWEEPIPDAHYILGADVAQGATFGAINEKGDWSTWAVYKRDGMHLVQVAEGRCKYDNFSVGELIAAVGSWYNHALVNVERNLAHGVIAGLRASTYPEECWYVPPVFGSIREDTETRYFFLKNAVTSKILVDTLINYMSAEQPRLILRSQRLLAEMHTLQRDSSGRVDTRGKDLVIATAMAVIADSTTDTPMEPVKDAVDRRKLLAAPTPFGLDPELHKAALRDEMPKALPEEPPDWEGASGWSLDDDPWPEFTETLN